MEDNLKNADIIFYSNPNGDIKVEVVYNDDTFWLTQKRMGELFSIESHTITYHLKEIYRSGELDEAATARKIRVVQKEGSRDVKRVLDFYNLDVIIAIGYRVNSFEATQFRIWATKVLKDYIIKGFVLDDERLKQGQRFGKDYFDELLNVLEKYEPANVDFILK
nr:RhuM family protein [Chitinophaga tropicalis]